MNGRSSWIRRSALALTIVRLAILAALPMIPLAASGPGRRSQFSAERAMAAL